jgi:hypothetical protein
LIFLFCTPQVFTPEIRFANIGERCNVAGSIRFKKMVVANDWGKAAEVAQNQVENGAQLLDVNFDDGMLDGEDCMRKFCNLIATEPEISKIPVVVDSSKFDVCIAGLECLQVPMMAGLFWLCIRSLLTARVPPGQMPLQFHLAQGGRGGVRETGQAREALWRRMHCHGL